MTTPADPERGLPATEAGRALLDAINQRIDSGIGSQAAYHVARVLDDVRPGILAIEAEAQRAPGDGGLREALVPRIENALRITREGFGAAPYLGEQWPNAPFAGERTEHINRWYRMSDRERAESIVADALSAIPPAPPSAGVWVTLVALAEALCVVRHEGDHPPTRIGGHRDEAEAILRALGPSAQEGAES